MRRMKHQEFERELDARFAHERAQLQEAQERSRSFQMSVVNAGLCDDVEPDPNAPPPEPLELVCGMCGERIADCEIDLLTAHAAVCKAVR